MIDTAIILLYFILLLTVGIFSKSKHRGFNKFSKVKDSTIKNNKLILITTIFASTIGGGTTFGLAEKIFANNIAYSYGLLFVIPIDIVIAYYIVPRIVKYYGTETIGDIMETSYGYIGRYIAGISVILVSIGMLAAQISVSAKIFEYMTNINYVYCIIISYGIIVIYTTIGGLRSVLFTNQLQFFAIIFAIPVICFCGIYYLGIHNFIDSVPLDKVSPYHNHNLLIETISASLGFATMNLFPTFIQRVLINKNNVVTSKAIYIKSAIYAIFLVFITLDGLLAFIIFPSAKAGTALPQLINYTIPVGLQGLVIVGLLAAVMSTADSDLNITSITLVKDFLKPILNIKQQQIMLLLARIVNILIGSLSIIVALCFQYVADLVIFFAGFWGAVILVPLVFILFDISISRIGLIISSSLGLLGFIIWEIFFSTVINFKGVFIGTMINLICFGLFYIISVREKK